MARGKQTMINMKRIENNLDLLKESGRLREAIVLCYQTFITLAKNKFAKDRPKHRTFREFAMEIVKEGLDPGLVYNFTTLYEEIRFGKRPATQDAFMDAHKMLKRLEDELKSVTRRPATASVKA